MTDKCALSADRVREIAFACMYRDDDPKRDDGSYLIDPTVVHGIVNDYGFHPTRLAEHRDVIRELLAELPDEFHATKGGGWSFLNACMDRHGNHWAEHPTMGLLFALGEAAGLARCLFPREVWSALPGSVPYYAVLTDECPA